MDKDAWIQRAKALLFDCGFCVDSEGIRKEIRELIEQGGGYTYRDTPDAALSFCTGEVFGYCIDVRAAPGKGLGLFAGRNVAAGTLVAVSKIVTISGSLEGIDDLEDYSFHWPLDDGSDGTCVAFGPASFANHSSNPTCELIRDTEKRTIGLKTLRDVAAGTELTFTYRCELWFEEIP